MENYDDYDPALDSSELRYERIEHDLPSEELNLDLQDLGRQYLE
jgi:hypothetical protein